MQKYQKKITKLLLSIFSIFLLTACSTLNSDSNGEPTEDETSEEVQDTTEEMEEQEVNQDLSAWIPRLNNVQYDYEGSGNEFASFNWFPQFNEENYYQITKDNSGTTMVEIYEYTEDEIIRVYGEGESYYRDNLASIWGLDSFDEREIVLKAPISVGTTWSHDDTTYEITEVAKNIEVPAGDYETIEVTIENNDTTIKKYYAEDVGLVYEQTDTAGLTIESKLKEIQENTTEEIPVTVYQADDQLMALDKIETNLSLSTNDPARIALAELLRGENAEADNIFLLPEETKINYLFLNQDRVVEADLSSEYISNMNAGSSGEAFALQGLTNTLTQYYGVDELLLTIDGEPYESGHILLETGERLSFDDSNINE